MTEVIDFVWDDELSSHGYVSLLPFRSAFERSGRTIKSVADAMGCDESYVRKLMGRSKRHNTYISKRTGQPKKYVKQQTQVSYETGVRLARALHLDPYQVGL